MGWRNYLNSITPLFNHRELLITAIIQTSYLFKLLHIWLFASILQHNYQFSCSHYRYPDLTSQSEYLAKAIFSTIQEDLFEELYFLQRYDELKKEIQQIIDMPDKHLSNIIIYLHQNKGIFPNRRKKQFEEITEEEFAAVEKIYKEIFNS
jgi:hypothetical protein